MKAIFMVDMPKSCLECEFCGYIADIKDGFRSCFLNKHCFEERDAKEEYLMCPLRPLPDKLNNFEPILVPKDMSGILNNMYCEYENGWNDCLAKITGETE